MLHTLLHMMSSKYISCGTWKWKWRRGDRRRKDQRNIVADEYFSTMQYLAVCYVKIKRHVLIVMQSILYSSVDVVLNQQSHVTSCKFFKNELFFLPFHHHILPHQLLLLHSAHIEAASSYHNNNTLTLVCGLRCIYSVISYLLLST